MREEQRYQLPAAILIETMRGLYATVVLRATLASLPEGWNEPCQADLIFVQGMLHTCAIHTMDGHLLLQQHAAFQMLERLGELEWTLHPSLPHDHDQIPQARPPMKAGAASWKTTPAMIPGVLETVPHRHKQVLFLLESQKCTQEIARLLRLSEAQVEQLLGELAAHHLITRDEERRSI